MCNICKHAWELLCSALLCSASAMHGAMHSRVHIAPVDMHFCFGFWSRTVFGTTERSLVVFSFLTIGAARHRRRRRRRRQRCHRCRLWIVNIVRRSCIVRIHALPSPSSFFSRYYLSFDVCLCLCAFVIISMLFIFRFGSKEYKSVASAVILQQATSLPNSRHCRRIFGMVLNANNIWYEINSDSIVVWALPFYYLLANDTEALVWLRKSYWQFAHDNRYATNRTFGKLYYLRREKEKAEESVYAMHKVFFFLISGKGNLVFRRNICQGEWL